MEAGTGSRPRLRTDAGGEIKDIPESTMIEDTKNDMLYVGVTQELRRGRACLEYGRNEQAATHLREAWSLFHDYDGLSELRMACRDFENELNHWHKDVAPRAPNRLRATTLPSVPGSAGSNRLSRISNDSSLFGRLLTELQKESPDGRSRMQDPQGQHLPPLARVPDHDRKSAGRSVNTARFSSGSFEGIDHFLHRLQQDQGVHQRTPSQEALIAANTCTVEKVLGWQAHRLPKSPSAFQNSEEPSPRRHSFPIASPPVSSSPPPPHERERPLHVEFDGVDAPDYETPSPAAPSAEYSRSNYSRKCSHDETNTALSDTPALTKLIDQMHTNPFVDSNNSITCKIRRLSTDSLSISPLSIPTVTHERSEPTAPSPLRESFIAEELPALSNVRPLDGSSGSPSTSNSSPLRQNFPIQSRERTEESNMPRSQPISNGRNIPQTDGLFTSTTGNETDSSTSVLPLASASATQVLSKRTASPTNEVSSNKSVAKSTVQQDPNAQMTSTDSINLASSSPSFDSATIALRPQPLTFVQKPSIRSDVAAAVTPASPSAPATTAKADQAEDHPKPTKLPFVSPTSPKHTTTASPPRTPPRSIRPTSAVSASTSSATPHRSTSPSPSVHTLASIFESPKSAHRTPQRSSPGTQRAFSEGLARVQAAFINNGSSSSTKIQGTSSGNKLKQREQPKAPGGSGGGGSISSGRNSPSDPFTTSNSNKDRPPPTGPLPSTGEGPFHRSGASVSQRVLAINERPPWQIPGRSWSSNSASASASASSASGAAAATRPWQRGRQGSAETEAVGNAVWTKSGGANGGTTTTMTTRTMARSQSNPGFVRFGSEMGRGAGLPRH